MSSLLSRESPTGQAPTPDQVKTLVVVALRPVGVLLALSAAVVAVTLVSSNSDLTGTAGAIAATWLAVHHVPLGIGGADVGILPLLPTLVLMASVARGCSRAVSPATSRRHLLRIAAAAVAGPLALAAVMLAIVKDASGVIALSTPNALATFAWVLGVHAVPITIGVAAGTWPAIVQKVHIPPWMVSARVPAARAGMALLAGGAVVTVLSLLASWSAIEVLLHTGDGAVGALGLTVVSILYLPNVVVGASAVVAGSSAHVGAASVSLFDTMGGPIPAVPVLAALPESIAQAWWPIMLVVPVAAAVLLGRGCAAATLTTGDAVRSTAAASVAVSVVSVVVGFAAGGRFGTFGHIGVDVALVGLVVFAWCAVLGGAVAAVSGYFAHRHDHWDEHSDADDPRDDDYQDNVYEESDQPETGDEPLAIESAEPGTDYTDTIDAEADAAVVDEEPRAADSDADVVDAEIVEIDDAANSKD